MSPSADCCPLCETPTSALRPWLTMPIDVKKRGAPVDSGALVWCDACDLGTTRTQPDDAALSSAYELSAYYTHGGSHMVDLPAGLIDRVLVKAAYLRDSGSLMDREGLLRRAPGARSVLDIGCGNGDFLAAMAGDGRRLVAIEPDPGARAVAAAKGLEVLPGSAEEPPPELTGQSFDLITMTHVLEHCRDPLRALRNVRDLLGPNGVFYCEVPNCGATYFRTLAQISEMLDVPRHLHFFTTDSLTGLCRKAGLQVFDQNYHGYTRHFTASWRGWENSIHAMLAERGVASPSRTPLNSFALLARSAWAAPGRKYDCLGIFARVAPAKGTRAMSMRVRALVNTT
ncbi:MAG: class I SAM-dependent methyltransferase [Tabrizicola sp.]